MQNIQIWKYLWLTSLSLQATLFHRQGCIPAHKIKIALQPFSKWVLQQKKLKDCQKKAINKARPTTPSKENQQQDLRSTAGSLAPTAAVTATNFLNTHIPHQQLRTLPFWNIDGLLFTHIAQSRLKEWEAIYLPSQKHANNPSRDQTVKNYITLPENPPNNGLMQNVPSSATCADHYTPSHRRAQTAKALAIFRQSTQWKQSNTHIYRTITTPSTTLAATLVPAHYA